MLANEDYYKGLSNIAAAAANDIIAGGDLSNARAMNSDEARALRRRFRVDENTFHNDVGHVFQDGLCELENAMKDGLRPWATYSDDLEDGDVWWIVTHREKLPDGTTRDTTAEAGAADAITAAEECFRALEHQTDAKLVCVREKGFDDGQG